MTDAAPAPQLSENGAAVASGLAQAIAGEANIVLSHNKLGAFEVPVDLFLEMIFKAFVPQSSASPTPAP